MLVNFHVSLYDGQLETLTYNAQEKDTTLGNMWDMEKRVSFQKDEDGQEFNFVDGDFILYDLSKAMSDDYKSGGTH